ncbi:MAG TPA: hypothetical protein VFZ41_05665 [Solirubrobacterales bacterium]
MGSYWLDELIETLLDERRENVALALLAASCLMGIVAIRRH